MNKYTQFQVIQMRADTGWHRDGLSGFQEDVNEALNAGWVPCGGVYQVESFYHKQVTCLAMMQTPPPDKWKIPFAWLFARLHLKHSFHPDVCQKCGWEHQGIETCYPPRK